MLNYIWAGLIILSFGFALWTDVTDLTNDTYRNGQPLPNGNYDLVFKFYTTKRVPASKLVRCCCWEPRV